MKNIIKYLLLPLLVTAVFVSCEKPQSEFGNSLIYFSNTEPQLPLLDELHTTSDLATLPDSVVYLTTVYRSGITEELGQIKVLLSVDQDYVENMILTANELEESDLTDMQRTYKNAMVMPQSMFSVPTMVTIPKGDRKVVVPITLKMSALKSFRNDYLNYSFNDFHNSAVTKDKMLVLNIIITGTSSFKFPDKQSRCLIGVTKCLTNL